MLRFRLRTLLIVAAFAVGSFIAVWIIRGLARFEMTVRGADTIVLYEGLPHPMYEEELLDQERRTKDIQELNGYPFYREPLALNGADAKVLADLLGNPNTFEPFTIEKPCGGFHPDYAADFHRGMSKIRVLICFGCGEVKVFGPLMDSRFELVAEARKTLDGVLKSYRKNRPPRQFDDI